jgi:hypothetical protein
VTAAGSIAAANSAEDGTSLIAYARLGASSPKILNSMMRNAAISWHSMAGEATAFAADQSRSYQKLSDNGVTIGIAPEQPITSMQSYMKKKTNKERIDFVSSYIYSRNFIPDQ